MIGTPRTSVMFALEPRLPGSTTTARRAIGLPSEMRSHWVLGLADSSCAGACCSAARMQFEWPTISAPAMRAAMIATTARQRSPRRQPRASDPTNRGRPVARWAAGDGARKRRVGEKGTPAISSRAPCAVSSRRRRAGRAARTKRIRRMGWMEAGMQPPPAEDTFIHTHTPLRRFTERTPGGGGLVQRSRQPIGVCM